MYRKMFTGMICLMLLGGAFFVPRVRADEADKKTIVTINEPIQVPGKVLPAGTYVFKLPDANDSTRGVAIYNADETRLITMVSGIPDFRTGTSGKKILQLEEPSGQPEALKAWFYPGYNSGVEFVYPAPKG